MFNVINYKRSLFVIEYFVYCRLYLELTALVNTTMFQSYLAPMGTVHTGEANL